MKATTAMPGAVQGFPAAGPVDAQPLLAQVRRLGDALEVLGTPLPEPARRLLERAAAEGDDARAARLVQEALDPLCLAALRIPTSGPIAVIPHPSPPDLVEQGWRTVLVKVCNDAGATGPLRVHSDSARPLPGGPKDEVARRWMEIAPFAERPLEANLGGLALEYRVVQLYARGYGRKKATIAFDAGRGGVGPSPVTVWEFGDGTAGWRALNDCRIAARGGRLVVTDMGRDPFLAAPVRMGGGAMRLRLRLTCDHDDIAQFFWATDDAPQFDGGRMVSFSVAKSSVPQEVTVDFAVAGTLRQIRLDPVSQKPGRVEIARIELTGVDGPDRWAKADFALTVARSRPVTFRVRDEQGRPATAAFLIRDSRGRVCPPQNRRLAPDFFFQPQIYRADRETVRLPDGVYTVHCSRGPESVPETRTLTVAGKAATFAYTVRRWVDPAARGWWSGDHHIHAAGCLHYENPTQGVRPEDMARHTAGEDLKVGCNLTWGPCFDFQKTFFTGKLDTASRYPYLLRYDIEVSGFGSSPSGHLCLLRLREQIPPGGTSKDHWPTLGLNTLRWAKRQGAVCGTAHSALGLTDFVGRLPYPDGPHGLPNYALPAFDSIGANEFVVQATHTVPGPKGTPVPAIDFLATMNTDRVAEWNIWYHVLNCGYRPRVSGETDFPCISGERVGKGRVYVRQRGRLDFDDWCEGIREGRSYVSDGTWHLMDFAVGGVPVGERGSEVRLPAAGRVPVTVRVAGRDPERGSGVVEIVVNGYPVASRTVPADGKERVLTFSAPVSRSAWVAARVFPHAHTNPVWALVGGRPVRASRRSAQWCRKGVDQCWERKKPFYAPKEMRDAQAAYDHARRAYDRILAESDVA